MGPVNIDHSAYSDVEILIVEFCTVAVMGFGK